MSSRGTPLPPRTADYTSDRAHGMLSLENPEESPCFGCGPRHPRGLRLQFERTEGSDGVPEVRTRFVPKPDEIGWPGLFHHGLHFLVLNEVSYWAALTLTGKIWVLEGPATYSFDRLPRVGVAHVATDHDPRNERDRDGKAVRHARGAVAPLEPRRGRAGAHRASRVPARGPGTLSEIRQSEMGGRRPH